MMILKMIIIIYRIPIQKNFIKLIPSNCIRIYYRKTMIYIKIIKGFKELKIRFLAIFNKKSKNYYKKDYIK